MRTSYDLKFGEKDLYLMIFILSEFLLVVASIILPITLGYDEFHYTIVDSILMVVVGFVGCFIAIHMRIKTRSSK